MKSACSGEKDEATKEAALTRKWLAVMLLSSLPIIIPFALDGELQRGLTAFACIGILSTAVRSQWRLRRHTWFWAVVAISVGIQIPIVIFFPWPTRKSPGYALLPVAMLDYALVYGCISLAGKLLNREEAINTTD